MTRPRFLLPLGLALALAACGDAADQAGNIDSLDEQLAQSVTGNGVDPAVASAVEGPIMVDPQLVSQANGDAVRPPGQPYSAAVPVDGAAPAPPIDTSTLKPAPAASGDCALCDAADRSLTLAALAAAQGGRIGGCAGRMRYGAGWANRLPADLPLLPGARVVEAAGADGAGCTLRAATFSVAAPLKTVLDWYYTRATAAGFTAEHQSDGVQHILAGARTRDGGAYALFLTGRADGGADVDLVANNGR